MAGSAFDGLTPALIWKHFAALTEIPHCSGNEAAVATVQRMSQACGVQDYRLLKTVKELKKEPPVYIK